MKIRNNYFVQFSKKVETRKLYKNTENSIGQSKNYGAAAVLINTLNAATTGKKYTTKVFRTDFDVQKRTAGYYVQFSTVNKYTYTKDTDPIPVNDSEST